MNCVLSTVYYYLHVRSLFSKTHMTTVGKRVWCRLYYWTQLLSQMLV